MGTTNTHSHAAAKASAKPKTRRSPPFPALSREIRTLPKLAEVRTLDSVSKVKEIKAVHYWQIGAVATGVNPLLPYRFKKASML
jgi:hypothetical protein